MGLEPGVAAGHPATAEAGAAVVSGDGSALRTAEKALRKAGACPPGERSNLTRVLETGLPGPLPADGDPTV